MKKPTGSTLDAIRRQYSGKGYTTDHKKIVIDWYKNQAKGKTNSVNDNKA